MTHLITIKGDIPSKKNNYSPVSDGRGGARFMKSDNLKTALSAIAWQIPAEVKHLKLRHPEMVFKFDVPTRCAGGDRDNKYTAILDILVMMGVLHDDCIRHCNGKHTILESEITDEHTTYIWITPRESGEDDRGGKPTVSARSKAASR
jgi:hypothetical protein